MQGFSTVLEINSVVKAVVGLFDYRKYHEQGREMWMLFTESP